MSKRVNRGKLQIGFKPRTVTEAQKRAILERDDRICQYCGEDAECVDHIIAREWQWDDSDENLVACCQLCNLIAGNKLFRNFTDKRLYLLDMALKGSSRANRIIWTITELDELQGRLRLHTALNAIVVESEDERQRARELLASRDESARKRLELLLRGHSDRWTRKTR